MDRPPPASQASSTAEATVDEVRIEVAGGVLAGTLTVPAGAAGLVVFAHGSGSSRHSPRNRAVAAHLNAARLATLLIDLLTADEDLRDRITAKPRFDIALLTSRLEIAVRWTMAQPQTASLAIGLFGASTGGAAALAAAAELREVRAIVIRGGRPDLAGPALRLVRAPTLMIVGGNDAQVLELNRTACAQMATECRLAVVPGATHLFEEPGALEEVSRLAVDWFLQYLSRTQGERHE
jgi:putative phosphoribosyl transferase